jgi:hypothetical protein
VRKRLWLGLAIVAEVLVALISRSGAQVIPMREITMPPWNALRVFEPTPLPQLADPDTRGDVAPEDTPVKTRSHPEYAARGIRAGDWMIYPTLSAGAVYDSNVFSSPNNQQSDVFAQLAAGVGAQTLWERHGISLNFGTQSMLYASHSGLNQTNATFNGTGHYDIDHSTQLLGAFKASYLHLGVGTLESPTGAIEPTPYTLLSGVLALRKEIGRFTTTVGTAVNSYDYGSTRAQNGSIISQDAQDGQIYAAYGRIDYAFSEKFSPFTSIEGNWRNLRGTPGQSLSSNGYRALAGFDIEFTHLIKGEVAAGYMRQHFFASSIGDVEGPAYRAMLTWSPSRLLDFYLNAEQIVTQISDTSTSGVLANAVQAGFNYEFRPNVVLSAAAAYEKDHFQGQSREDTVYAVNTRIKYALNNVISFAVGYRFTRRNSNVADANFYKHQVGIDASAHF